MLIMSLGCLQFSREPCLLYTFLLGYLPSIFCDFGEKPIDFYLQDSIMSTSGMDSNQINQALVAYPILNACMTFLGGFLTDRLGRKRSALTMGMVCFVMLGAFVFAASQGWNAYLVGACYGIFVGAYWSVSDLLYLVIPGESTPTNLRASVLGTLSLVLIAGGIVSTTIISICMRYVSSLALVCGVVCIPLVLLCLVIVMTKLGETKGVDMAKITGAEFDG